MKAQRASAALALALLIGGGHALAQNSDADARFERMKAERQAEAARQREAQQRYEQGVRDAAAAQARYEAEMARHDQEVRRANEAQADYQRRRADYEAQTGQPAPSRQAERTRPARVESRQARNINAQCERRARRRGRLIGGLVGGAAGGLIGRNNPAAAIATALPVSLLLGEAITRLLDCREREQAEQATEQVVQRVQQAQAQPTPVRPAQTAGAERGLGTTVAWTSETRPGVTGSSTVTAVRQEPGGGECMTVTDIIIVDGQETRAPKQLCRRPPSQRFVRV